MVPGKIYLSLCGREPLSEFDAGPILQHVLAIFYRLCRYGHHYIRLHGFLYYGQLSLQTRRGTEIMQRPLIGGFRSPADLDFNK